MAVGLIGDVRDRDALIIDDEIASGGTMIEAARFLRANGARRIEAAAVHPVLSGHAVERAARLADRAVDRDQLDSAAARRSARSDRSDQRRASVRRRDPRDPQRRQRVEIVRLSAARPCNSRDACTKGIRNGEITVSVRIWKRPHVRVGNRYRLDDGVDRRSMRCVRSISTTSRRRWRAVRLQRCRRPAEGRQARPRREGLSG